MFKEFFSKLIKFRDKKEALASTAMMEVYSLTFGFITTSIGGAMAINEVATNSTDVFLEKLPDPLLTSIGGLVLYGFLKFTFLLAGRETVRRIPNVADRIVVTFDHLKSSIVSRLPLRKKD